MDEEIALALKDNVAVHVVDGPYLAEVTFVIRKFSGQRVEPEAVCRGVVTVISELVRRSGIYDAAFVVVEHGPDVGVIGY